MEYKWNDGDNVHEYLMVADEDEGAKLFLVMPSDIPRGNGCQLKNMKCNLNTGKAFFLILFFSFYCKNGETLEQVAERRYVGSVCRDMQNMTTHNPGQAALGDSAWAGGVDKTIWRGPS